MICSVLGEHAFTCNAEDLVSISGVEQIFVYNKKVICCMTWAIIISSMCYYCSQPELYKNELVRQSSTDSADLEFCGKLHFALKYDPEVEALVVKVREVR